MRVLEQLPSLSLSLFLYSGLIMWVRADCIQGDETNFITKRTFIKTKKKKKKKFSIIGFYSFFSVISLSHSFRISPWIQDQSFSKAIFYTGKFPFSRETNRVPGLSALQTPLQQPPPHNLSTSHLSQSSYQSNTGQSWRPISNSTPQAPPHFSTTCSAQRLIQSSLSGTSTGPRKSSDSHTLSSSLSDSCTHLPMPKSTQRWELY